MTRTYRIWQKIIRDESCRKTVSIYIPYIHNEYKFWCSNKKRISIINKSWKIRNRYTRMLRHQHKQLGKKCGKLSAELDMWKMDEYFNVRYKKADYSEWFD